MLRPLQLLCVTLFFAACAAAPPAEEYLDTRTGATIFRVANPLLLYRRITTFTDGDAEFVQLAPFEINRAGDYRLYMWIELPSGEHTDSVVLIVDDQPMELPLVTLDRRSIGVGEHVYDRHAGWGTSGYYRLRDDELVALVSAEEVRYPPPDDGIEFVLAGAQPDVRRNFEKLLELTR